MGGYPFRLCLVTNRHLVKSVPLIDICKSALKGGVDAILLREPDMNPKSLVYVGKQFRMLTSRFGAKLIIKERVDVAQVVGADGVHLGADSISPVDVRKIWDGLIGYSAHSIEEMKELEEHVDYFFLSPIYHTKSKPMAKPLGVDYLRKAFESVKKPIYPLGGVIPERVGELVRAGARGVAVMSAFFWASDPVELAGKFLSCLGGSDDSA